MNNFGYVLVTKMLIEGKRKVRFMYREEPNSEQDSGWRFCCGDEPLEYFDNPDNSVIYNVDKLIAMDPSIKPYLNASVNTAFVREHDDGVFQVQEDFEFGHEGEKN